jgi:hypothetical protein
MDVTVPLHSAEEERTLLGTHEARARAIRNRFGVALAVRRGRVHVEGRERTSPRCAWCAHCTTCAPRASWTRGLPAPHGGRRPHRRPGGARGAARRLLPAGVECTPGQGATCAPWSAAPSPRDRAGGHGQIGWPPRGRQRPAARRSASSLCAPRSRLASTSAFAWRPVAKINLNCARSTTPSRAPRARFKFFLETGRDRDRAAGLHARPHADESHIILTRRERCPAR